MEYKRITTDNPITEEEKRLNMVFKKDGIKMIRFVGGEVVGVKDYITEKIAKIESLNDAETIKIFARMILSMLDKTTTQTVELGERLKMLEDKLEKGELEYVTRCKNCEYAQLVIHKGIKLDIYKCTLLKPNTNLFDVDFCRYAKKKNEVVKND